MSAATGAARLVAAIVAIAGSAAEADVAPELGGDEAAAQLEATITQARQREEKP